ncbi:uncharacterized protein LOC111055791 isoform X2 [Nilaparvata lugens]|uniref:uncharacterized protein LOC111055791 isoform X2 n=1 Tax=Nilaparvata lugens TaxID=108931 RepID=UPI00193E1684|nr:uncharacterized protein LOC111055791 isoform X2 [Nilaparvata lugens]
MKLSVSAFRAHHSAQKKILSTYHSSLNYGATSSASNQQPSSVGPASVAASMMVDKSGVGPDGGDPADPDSELRNNDDVCLDIDQSPSPSTPKNEEGGGMDKNQGNRTKSNQRWLKLRTTVQLSGAISTIQKKPPLKREDSFLKRFSTRQIPETQETMDTGEDGDGEGGAYSQNGARSFLQRRRHRRKHTRLSRTVVNPDENFYFYWLFLLTLCVLYNLWTLIVRESFPELQKLGSRVWFACDIFSDVIYLCDIVVQFRTGYLEQGLMVYDYKKLARHYVCCRAFFLDCTSLTPLDLFQYHMGTHPMLRFPRFLKVYRVYDYYYMVESRTVYPNLWRVINLIHILLILAHWFGCFYYLLSEAERFQGDWVYPYRPGEYATLTRKYLGSLYWSTLTLTTIGDLPTPETNADRVTTDGLQMLPRRGHKSRLLQFKNNRGYIFTIVSYLIGVFIFATIVGQVGNVITNRNANRLEFERLLDGAKTYMRHHKVPGGMKRRVLRWYDYSWSRGRIQGGGDINTALGLLPDKLKTELALHVNLSVLKKVTIFQECQPEFLHDLVLKMKAFIFTPGDLICRKGEVAREMFIIADGILEVMSETGRVLTTMKAGDFFGEIGILNLDGLNKRTADVRSVGYSELFSLSREDVLAAMTDYPEAEAILHSLGRKRLMEARNVNRNLRNLDNRNEKSFGRSFSPDPHNSRASKRIVQRLRSDVRGLKNVLRKSRRGGRSKDESLELQPLTSLQDQAASSSGKGLLNRMPNVWSDETSQEDEPTAAASNDGQEVIGAGLPLLQRLKLLREKEAAQAAAAAAATGATSAAPIPSSSSSTALADDKKDVEPGHSQLPLLQRLAQLKTKDDKPLVPESKTSSTTVRTQQKATPMSKILKTSKDDGKFGINISDKPDKGNVTWSGAIPKRYSTDESRRNQETDTQPTLEIKPRHIEQISTVRIPSAFGNKTSTWKVLKKVAIHDPPKTKQPVPRPTEGLPIDDEPPTGQSAPSFSQAQSQPDTDKKDGRGQEVTKNGDQETSSKGKGQVEPQFAQAKNKAQTLSVQCDDYFKPSSINRNKIGIDAHDLPDTSQKIGPSSKLRVRLVNKPESGRMRHAQSCDFPPGTSKTCSFGQGRQMISNVRMQNRTDNEQDTQVRSQSLDSCGSSVKEDGSRAKKVDDTAGFETRPESSNLQESSEDIELFNRAKAKSPESNETAERQNLKSILKKLSSSSLLQGNSDEDNGASPPVAQNGCELKKLMRAQTVEGYAARHSKLTKSVTFNRDTLQSPPHEDSTTPGSQFHFPKHPTQISQEEKREIQKPTRTEPLNDSTNESEEYGDESKVSAIDDLQLGYKMISDQLTNEENDQNEHISPKLIQGNIIEKPIDKNYFRSSPLLMKRMSKEEECFGDVLSGIKHVIQDQLEDFQSKFLNKFNDLEMEVKKRDDIICRLQTRIQELEENDPQENGDSSDNDQPFLRGDSVDTVIRSSPKLSSARSWEEPLEEEFVEAEEETAGIRNNVPIIPHVPNVPVPNVPPLLTMWGSTNIDIEPGTSSSSSESGEEIDYSTVPYNKNWEVEMLAEQLDQRANEPQPGTSGVNVRKRHSFSGHRTPHEDLRSKKKPLQTTKSLDECNDGSGRFSSLYRSMSIGNLHSTLMKNLGSFIWGNEDSTSQDTIPTISQTCPSHSTSPPPDI